MVAEKSTRDGILVYADGATAWIRVRGRGLFMQAHSLREFASRMRANGRDLFYVDLAECPSMDSTFIGTLTMIATEDQPRKPTIRLSNVSAAVREQLDDLGVSRVFEFTSSESTPAARVDMIQHDTSSVRTSREQVNQTMLRAHEALIQFSPDNEQKFRDVIAFLRDAQE